MKKPVNLETVRERERERELQFSKINIYRGYNAFSGITLIALVVTIVILIILATISINVVFSEDGIIKRTELADIEYRKSQAREKLVLTLGSAGIDKKMNSKYNQNDYLDGIILKEIENVKILGDIVVVDGFAFDINRNVPEIGKYVGREEEFVFPEVSLSKTITDDLQTATIRITAKEEKDGINKIEILENGYVIKTYTYDNIKEEILQDFEARRNGKYMVKVYGTLPITKMIEVSELVATVEYSPNGNKEYKKEHEVKITVSEEVDTAKSIKYQWTDTTKEPEAVTFSESCENGATIKKGELTGTWYLWVLVETETGKTRIEKSEPFYFDNEAPSVTLTSTPVSDTSFTLTATADDNNKSGVAKYEFYVAGEKVGTITTTEGTASYEVTGKAMGEYDSYVIVTDEVGNPTRAEKKARTKMYAWDTYNRNSKNNYVKLPTSTRSTALSNDRIYTMGQKSYVTFSSSTGYTFPKTQDICTAGFWNNYPSNWSSVLCLSNTEFWECLGKENSGSLNYSGFKVRIYKCENRPIYSKGSSRNQVVYSTSPNQYPDDNYSGTIWYVKKPNLE